LRVPSGQDELPALLRAGEGQAREETP